MRQRPERPRPKSVARPTGPTPDGVVPDSVVPGRDLNERILDLQRSAGNKAVAEVLAPTSATPTPIPWVQRAPTTYDPGESAKATDRGILDRDVQLLAGVGSGYNAAANSVLVADFRPNSATVRTSAREQLTAGSWLKIVESNTTDRYALLGFTDATGPEAGNTTLRAARAAAIANRLPGTARNGVVGAAPTGDFIVPGNATPEQRALNRSVLIRLPFAELREVSQVDRYAGAGVDFWRANPTKTVTDLLDEVGKRAAAQLERNGVPPPPFVPGTVIKGTDTLAFFNAADWKITVDADALTADSPQKGVTPASSLSTLTAASVGQLVQASYHEARHAEQAFLAARMVAEEAKSPMSPALLSRRVGIKQDVAEEAISASLVKMPDVLKAKADAWRAFMVGGRHIPYRTWNKELQDQIGVLLTVALPTMQTYEKKSPFEIRVLWEKLLHPTLDKNFRKDLSYRADALAKELKASPHQEAVDLEVRQHLDKSASALFVVLAKERGGAAIPDVDAFTKLPAEEADDARSKAQIWLLELEIALIDVKVATDEAYRAYPHEKDAYEVGQMVTDSVTEKGGP